MFHVELRRFPHVARSFNLGDKEVRTRIVIPWVQGTPIELDERRWTGERTRLTIYEAPEVAPEDRGLGRGWSNVTRSGEDVTEKLLADAREALRASSPQAYLPELKRELMASAGTDGISLSEAVALVDRRHASWRPSERLALAERAAWELLHEGALTLVRSGQDVPAEEWERILLSREAWTDPGAPVRVRAGR